MYVLFSCLVPTLQVSSCALELGSTSKSVGSSMAQLLTAANQGNESYTGVAARETANALKVLYLRCCHLNLS